MAKIQVLPDLESQPTNCSNRLWRFSITVEHEAKWTKCDKTQTFGSTTFLKSIQQLCTKWLPCVPETFWGPFRPMNKINFWFHWANSLVIWEIASAHKYCNWGLGKHCGEKSSDVKSQSVSKLLAEQVWMAKAFPGR